MKMELYRLRFNTANKNAEEIKSTYDFSPPPQEVLEKMAEAFRNLNGTEVVGAVWGYSPDSYSLYGWEDNDDERFKEFIYWIEQDALFGSYFDDRERFDADWKSGNYEPAAAMHFDKKDFIVLEKIKRNSLAEGDQSTE
ncbi:hypothetical protein [Paenibacillus amylolyticus]|uniref:hypothetical protein n=1 Tax=Paenibacillus amylolyticus TaxID=1451 RepID=UPI00096CE78E|nr:hypothetical protein [Paenibacillus amylolyticus]OMF47737.1 hypothetical protein BK136_02260 [Paenibacillus amylolyticus]